ncbi:DgyrCDS3305 [Dimorphilus gyrociliatus]|uniref:DgyrCDS3305 n=1 Tax=Dimorphilus gyrociliatus TaxID=2664684 RepID=A0A7I8VEL6_9ANNE|nr:DgyrCDS3305 [Dimorphilus gyrociliatus]
MDSAIFSQPEKAKIIHVFRNGDKRFMGKNVVINRRRTRNFDSFLNFVTGAISARVAVRSIRTPVGGTTITDLDQLEDFASSGKSYVAVGGEKFRKGIEYGKADTSPKRSPRATEVRPVEHNRSIQVSGRCRKVPIDILVIYVYTNGQDWRPAKRINVNSHLKRNFTSVLSEITDRIDLVTGAVLKLCRTDGSVIHGMQELEMNEKYVAVGREGFKMANYGSHDSAPFTTSPRLQKRKLPPINSRRARTSDNSAASNQTEETQRTTQSEPPYDRNNNNKGSRKPRQKRPEDDLFHSKPVRPKRSPEKVRETDYDKDEGGVFKAKTSDNEQENANAIEENDETRTEVPVDQQTAEEVEDEQVEEQRQASRNDNAREQKDDIDDVDGRNKEQTADKPEESNETEESPPEQAEKTNENQESEVAKDEQQEESKAEAEAAVEPEAETAETEKKEEKETEANDEDDKTKNEAAIKIQSTYRGHATRKSLKNSKENSETYEEDSKEIEEKGKEERVNEENVKVKKDLENVEKKENLDGEQVLNLVESVAEAGYVIGGIIENLAQGQENEDDLKLRKNDVAADKNATVDEKDNLSTKGINEAVAEGDEIHKNDETIQTEENGESSLVDNSQEINEPDNMEERTEDEQERHLETHLNDVEQDEYLQTNAIDNLAADQENRHKLLENSDETVDGGDVVDMGGNNDLVENSNEEEKEEAEAEATNEVAEQEDDNIDEDEENEVEQHDDVETNERDDGAEVDVKDNDIDKVE